jgi:RHS repeat-associated protein
VLWALTDHLGTVRDVIDSMATVVNHIRYDSFGKITSETNAAVDFLFAYTGRERDEETGLYYYRARYYDPAVGRFVSEDPLGFAAGDTNLVRYVGNSVTALSDPSGLEMRWGLGSVGEVVGEVFEKVLGWITGRPPYVLINPPRPVDRVEDAINTWIMFEFPDFHGQPDQIDKLLVLAVVKNEIAGAVGDIGKTVMISPIKAANGAGVFGDLLEKIKDVKDFRDDIGKIITIINDGRQLIHHKQQTYQYEPNTRLSPYPTGKLTATLIYNSGNGKFIMIYQGWIIKDGNHTPFAFKVEGRAEDNGMTAEVIDARIDQLPLSPTTVRVK